jgi:hypothetical protein
MTLGPTGPRATRFGRGLMAALVLTALAVANLGYSIVNHRGINLILAIVWFMSSVYWWVSWGDARKTSKGSTELTD